MRLATSWTVRAWLVAVVILCSQCEVSESVGDEVIIHSECAGNAEVFIDLLNVWAGVSSFTDGFAKQQHVAVIEHAWIEWSTVAEALLSAVYGATKWCTDFYNYAWRGWKFRNDLIVVGGPSCCPFNVSGKRQRHNDPRSSQGMDTAQLALTLGALVLIIENVVNLVEEDAIHGIFTTLDDCLVDGGMQLVGLWKLCDGCMGGSTGRQRVFPCWERMDMASCLPPWGEEPQAMASGTVRDYLLPCEQTQHLAVGGQSQFVKCEESVDALSAHCPATQIGVLYLQGPRDEWMCGEGLKLSGDARVWRVLQITKSKLKVLFDSRSQPEFKWVLKADLSFSQRRTV